MINLLPPDVKKSASYGIKNHSLLRWVAAFLVGLAGIGIIILFGHYQLNQSIASTQNQIAQSEERLKQQNLTETQARTEDIDSSIKLALQVLEKKVLFSKLIQKIGGIMPAGTVLEGISLDDIEGGIGLQASATSYQAATQIQVNITDQANGVFETADILTVDCSAGTEDGESTTATEDEYPCAISLQALFADNNPYLYINQQAGDENENL